jgi:hypothetical protein
MKAYWMAAGALLLGTSAFAYDAGKEMNSKQVTKSEKSATTAQNQQMKKAVLDVLSDARVPQAQPASMVGSEPAKWRPASAMTWDDPKDSMPMAGDTKADLDPEAGDPNLDLTVKPDMMPMTQDAVAGDDQVEAVSQYQGVGGPDETEAMPSVDSTPRAAAGNYPACHPGPGDDSCIQLYERGVRQQLSSWSQPTGGFAGEPVQTAMADTNETAYDNSGASDEVIADTATEDSVSA